MTKSEKINLVVTVLGPVVVSGIVLWLSWSVKATLQIREDKQDKDTTAALTAEHQFLTDNYVNRVWYEKGQSETNAKLDNLSKMANDIRVDVGRLQDGKIEQPTH